MEDFLQFLQYSWIPLIGLLYRDAKAKEAQQDAKIDELGKKISHQMTKQDVIEVVNNAVEKLTLKMDKDLLKIDNGVHQLKQQFTAKDSAISELNHSMLDLIEALRSKADEKK